MTIALAVDLNTLLDDLLVVLSRQIEFLKKDEMSRAIEMSRQAEPLAAKLGEYDLSSSDQESRFKIKSVRDMYAELSMILHQQKEESEKNIISLRKGRRTLGIYRKMV